MANLFRPGGDIEYKVFLGIFSGFFDQELRIGRGALLKQ